MNTRALKGLAELEELEGVTCPKHGLIGMPPALATAVPGWAVLAGAVLERGWLPCSARVSDPFGGENGSHVRKERRQSR